VLAKPYPEPGFEPMGEREMLTGYLDYHRGVLLWKIDGVPDDDLRRPLVPSGTSLLGLVKHLGAVERWWFQINFAGLDVDDLGAEMWTIGPDETTAGVISFYEQECERSREITAAASLDDVGRRAEPERGTPTLRWILTHMIEETARHNGHADILRELVDGRTGD
jgi:uncharacterized damage-inducible protein DinB